MMKKLLLLIGCGTLTVTSLQAQAGKNSPTMAVPSTPVSVGSTSADQPLDLRLLLPQLEQLRAVVSRAGGTLELQINGVEIEELFVPLQNHPAFKVELAGNELVVRPATDGVVADLERQRERLRKLIRDNARLEKQHAAK